MAGKFGKFGLIALFVSCAFIVHVAEAPADHESTNEEDFCAESTDRELEFYMITTVPYSSKNFKCECLPTL